MELICILMCIKNPEIFAPVLWFNSVDTILKLTLTMSMLNSDEVLNSQSFNPLVTVLKERHLYRN